MKIIDFHIHYYPESLAGKVEEHNGHLIAGHYGCTRDGLLRSMDDSKIDVSLALPLAAKAENSKSINRWAALQNNSPRLLHTGSIHPDDPDPLSTVRMIKEAGFKGVKMHPEYQNFRFDEERLAPIWQALIDNDLFLLTHAGFDIKFSEPFKSDPVSLAAFIRKYPKLKLVLAHMGSMAMWDKVEEHLIGMEVYMDLAFTAGNMDKEQLTRMIKKHGADKILFGSDFPWGSQQEAVDFVHSLGLSPEENEMIFYGNGARLLGL